MSERVESIILEAALTGRSTEARIDELPEGDRWISAEFLGDVLTGRCGAISPGGFIVKGVEVRGILNLPVSGPRADVRSQYHRTRPHRRSPPSTERRRRARPIPRHCRQQRPHRECPREGNDSLLGLNPSRLPEHQRHRERDRGADGRRSRHHRRPASLARHRRKDSRRSGRSDLAAPASRHAERLTETGGRIVDVGCGFGHSSTIMAKAFPKASITGFDFHTGSIEAARRAASAEDLGGRVSFEVAGAAQFGDEYDLICFFDCLHDMGDPVGIARHAAQ